MGFNFTEVTRSARTRSVRSSITDQVGVAFYKLARTGQLAVAIGQNYMANCGLGWKPGQQLKVLTDTASGALKLVETSEGGWTLAQQKTKKGLGHFILATKFDVAETISRVRVEASVTDGNALLLTGIRFPGTAPAPVDATEHGAVEVGSNGGTVSAGVSLTPDEADAEFEAKLASAAKKANKRKGALAAV